MKKYFAVPFSQKRPLEVELNLRLSLALIAEEFGIPFVYTPIGNNAGLGRSEYALHALDRKWEEYFSSMTGEFHHVETLKTDEVVFWDERDSAQGILFWVDPMYRDSFRIPSGVTEKIGASCDSFSSPMEHNEIPIRSIRKFTTKSHRVYMESFATEKREPFQNNTLRVGIFVEDERLKARFFLSKFVKTLDLFEACARVAGNDLEIHLLSGSDSDEKLADNLQREKAEKLTALCSRSYVTLHENASFEQMVNTMVSADITLTSETYYCQYLYGTFLTLLSDPRQIRVEMLAGLNQLSLNNCFLMWSGDDFFFEKKKMSNMLRAAEGKISDQKWESEFPSGRPKAWGHLKKEQINVTSGVIDGLGSYFFKTFMVQVVSDYYGLSYIHSYPSYFEHAFFNDVDLPEARKDCFALDEGYPSFEEIFGESDVNIHFFRLLPPLSRLRALKLACDELVVTKIARLKHWPIPEHYLQHRISQIGDRFRCKYGDYKDSFQSNVLNVALHVRSFDSGATSAYQSAYFKARGLQFKCDLDYYFDMISVICNSMRELQTPFHMHVYSNNTRNDMRSLEKFEHVQLHLKEDNGKSDISHFVEMSRADLLFPAPSYMSLTAGMLAKPSQIQVITTPYYGSGEAIGLLLTKSESTALDGYHSMKDPRYFERLLKL